MCVACPCADADDFSLFKDKNFLFGKLSCEKKEYATVVSIFTPSLGACQTQENTQGAATSIGVITYTVHASEIESSLYVPEEPDGIHAQ